ncbi:DUF3836 domain-containing protein [Catalinimonas alkaloidigena]|nr:DUF3836 domain-containing protein [Catalinimonas alkaloidigena]
MKFYALVVLSLLAGLATAQPLPEAARPTNSWHKAERNPSSFPESLSMVPQIQATSDTEPDSTVIFRFSSLYDSVPLSKSVSTHDQVNRRDTSITYYWQNQQWVLGTRFLHFYNEANRPLLDASYNWNASTREWEGVYKYEDAYDASGRKILSAYYEGDEHTKAWRGISKVTYEYADAQRQRIQIDYQWSLFTQMWIPDRKCEYTFDETGTHETLVYFLWKESTEQWVINRKTENKYTTTGDLTLSTSYDWHKVETQWQPDLESEYTYDELGVLLSETRFRWNSTTVQWDILFKSEYDYGPNGNLTLISYKWDAQQQQWLASQKRVDEFTDSGLPLLYALYEWKNGEWTGLSKTEYTYDLESNLTSFADFQWDESTNLWKGSRMVEYAYDEAHRLISQSWYNWDLSNQQWKGQSKKKTVYNALGTRILVEYYLWNETANAWTLDTKTYYYYSDQVTSSSSLLAADTWQAYPNPARDVLTISLPDGIRQAQVRLFSLTGKLMQTEAFSGQQHRLALRNLAAGIYLLELQTPQGRATRKVLVE